jgi:hypothetical protein
MIGRAASCLIFLAALLGSGTWIAEIAPLAGVPVAQEKFTWLAAHADEYDTLFIGSSRIYRGIQPAVFDELTAAAGMPTHSFNFGIDAMTPPEDAFVFDRMARLHPKRLRWVVLECGTLKSGVGYGGEENARSVYWHDTARTALALRALIAPADGRLDLAGTLSGPEEMRRPMTLALAHGRLWCARTFNAGRGALYLQSWLRPPPRGREPSVLGPAGDGYVAAGNGRPMTPDNRADYERRFAQCRAQPAAISFLDRDAQHSLDTMLNRIRVFGARLVLVIPPYLAEARPFPQPGDVVPVLDYSEIEKWPALFDPANRVDRSHLNPAGAELFTRAMAADFIELAKPSR